MRHVELTGFYAAYICSNQTLKLSKIAKILALPKIRTISIAVSTIAKDREPVRSLIAEPMIWKSLNCVAVGCFDLDLEPEWVGKVRDVTAPAAPTDQLRMHRLVEAEPEIRDLLCETGARGLYDEVRKFRRRNLVSGQRITCLAHSLRI